MVEKDRNIIEHNKLTNDSIRLLKGMREEAVKDAVNFKCLKSNTLNDICYWRESDSYGIGEEVNIAFKLNGKDLLLKCDIPIPRDLDEIFKIPKLVAAKVSDFIATLFELEVESAEVKIKNVQRGGGMQK